MSDETAHILAVVNSFVLPRHRERLRLKPHELIERLHHDLPSQLDPRRIVEVTHVAKHREVLVSAIEGITRSRRAFVMGAYADTRGGDMPLDKAIEEIERVTAAAASIEMGELVYYKPEVWNSGHGLRPASYLLVKDPARRERVLKQVERLKLNRR